MVAAQHRSLCCLETLGDRCKGEATLPEIHQHPILGWGPCCLRQDFGSAVFRKCRRLIWLRPAAGARRSAVKRTSVVVQSFPTARASMNAVSVANNLQPLASMS